jgi:hypothetical protein
LDILCHIYKFDQLYFFQAPFNSEQLKFSKWHYNYNETRFGNEIVFAVKCKKLCDYADECDAYRF